MKRCPECDSFFPDAEHFCELDGTLLVAVDDPPTGVAPHSRSSLLPIGALAGILLGVLLVLFYFVMSRQTAQENSNTASSSSSSRQQEFLQPRQPATASPSVEPSVEPSASPSVETPSPQSSPAQVELSRSNPAAGARGSSSDPVIIRLNSGATIEADEAWQTAEGIWYRKHSVVSLLDPKNVKAIEKTSPATPQPSAPTSSPSP